LKFKKIILIICDGMPDRRIKDLGNKTPLEYAKTTNFNKIAEGGITGVIDILRPGSPPGSDAGHLALFGYDVEKYYPNRGPIEALGSNLNLPKGALACRFNLATVHEKDVNGVKTLFLEDRRAGRIKSEEGKKIVAYLQEKIKLIKNVKIKIIHNSEHRGILILEGLKLSDKITDNDPHEINTCVNISEPLSGYEESETARSTAEIVNKIVKDSYLLLKDHEINRKRVEDGYKPANILLPRGAGISNKVEPFQKKWGLKSACVAKLYLYKGVAKYVGMDVFDAKGATGDTHTDVEAKFRKAVELIKDYDFVFVHIKGADSASHDKKILEKVKMIEKIDSALKIIIDDLIKTEKAVIAITSDHSTSSESGFHIGDPPVLVISAPGIVIDDVIEFNEKSVLKGGLGRIQATDLLPILLNYSSRAMEFGLKPTRKMRVYRSDECSPLTI
jgi:2,3-bisphosphoglycerate-independent phosphoglycerate mutase